MALRYCQQTHSFWWCHPLLMREWRNICPLRFYWRALWYPYQIFYIPRHEYWLSWSSLSFCPSNHDYITPCCFRTDIRFFSGSKNRSMNIWWGLYPSLATKNVHCCLTIPCGFRVKKGLNDHRLLSRGSWMKMDVGGVRGNLPWRGWGASYSEPFKLGVIGRRCR